MDCRASQKRKGKMMSKTLITHTCGHEITHNLVGKYNDRDRKAEWLATMPCLDCKRSAELETARETTSDLPAPTGSEKQVNWATTIRAKLVTEVDQCIEKIRPQVIANGKEENLDKLREIIMHNADAKFWIDNRDCNGESIVKMTARKMASK